MNRNIHSHQQRLDNLFQNVSRFSDPKDKSEWAKYLCILVSGFIEASLRVLLEDYVSNKSSSKIQRFLAGYIKDITNCKTSRINEVLEKFDTQWADDFRERIKQKSNITDEIKNSIDTVITNRHKIAHGGNVGITYANIQKHYNNAKDAIRILEDIIC